VVVCGDVALTTGHIAGWTVEFHADGSG
jgi:hypothetical protein